MYKDKAKQKEATKERVRRYRDKQKGVTPEQGVTGCDIESVTSNEALHKGVTGGCGFPYHGTMYYGQTSNQTVRCPDCNTVLARRSDAQATHNRYMAWQYNRDA